MFSRTAPLLCMLAFAMSGLAIAQEAAPESAPASQAVAAPADAGPPASLAGCRRPERR